MLSARDANQPERLPAAAGPDVDLDATVVLGAIGVRAFLTGWTCRVLDGVNRRLEGRDWIAADDFTIADLLLASVLRQIRHTDLMDAHPNVKAFYDRAMARPAWRRTLDLYAERLGADRTAIE